MLLRKLISIMALPLLISACTDTAEETVDAPRGPLGKADRLGSCTASCGTKSSNGTCWCDEACTRYGDCCDDYEAICLAPEPPQPPEPPPTSECPALEPVDESPLPVQSTNNAVVSTTVGGKHDDYIYNQQGNRKLGIRRDWGGAIVFFGIDNGSSGTNSSNVIDGNDTGREVQIAMYDHERWYQGCAAGATCQQTGTTCPHTMTYFGWNPVQGGNRCNKGSGYDASKLAIGDGAVSITTQPLQWNPNWDRTDCSSDVCSNSSQNQKKSDVELTQRVRFVQQDIVELSYKVKNIGPLNHKPAPHEFPTLYASFGKDGTPDLRRLYDSTGREITSGWSTDAHGFRHQNFTSPGGWASLQNPSADYGVGLYYESGMGSFQAWNKENEPTKFNNFRGLFSFALPAYGEVRARSYLILGSIGSVGAQAQWLDNHLAPFGWLDSPAPDANVSGTMSVHGWAMDNKAVSRVEMSIDGGAPVTLSYGAYRPDVCTVWPGYPACSHNRVGFQGSFNTNSLAPADCGHVIEINAIDNQGNQHIIARQRFHVAQ